MKRGKLNLVLLVLCFCTGSLSNPVEEKYNEIELYSYKGHIDTTTTNSNENLARWTISAELQRILHINTDYIVIKLENIKTSLFNGNRSNLNSTNEQDIPEEAAKILEQPFALKWESNITEYILVFKPNEPLWSINMKRGIANILNFEYEKPKETSHGEIAPLEGPSSYTQLDNTIYGKCMVEYTRKSASRQDGIVHEKKMDQFNCTQPAFEHFSNTFKAPGADKICDFNQIYLLTLKKRGKYFKPEILQSKSRITYKTSPSAIYAQQVDQEQLIEYINTFASVEIVDISEITEKRELTYEFEDDSSSGRHVDEKDSAKLTKQLLEHYEEFTKLFKYAPVEDNVQSKDSAYEMFKTLLNMDVKGLKNLENIIGNGDFDNGYIYFSMLPYVGTNASVKYLTEFYKSDKINANEEFAARMLVTFPQYIQEPSDAKLLEMEGLMDNPYARKKISKNAAVFGFATAVGFHCRQDAISKKYKHKYIDMFHRKYLEGQTYEEKMVYMLGLVNMAECLDFDFMNSITTNSSDSGDFRFFAINGFKTYLSNHDNIDEVYQIYWPLVQKTSEPFEVRVAALELLLSSPLNEEQFNLIIQKYSDDLNEPEDRHLANYVLTTIHSIQNSTGYFDHLGALASEAIKNANIHRIPKSWATGKYRLSYTDSVPNIGSSLEARLISDVKTNLFPSIEISFNSFGNSFDFGTYTLLVKFKGMYNNNQMFGKKSSNSPTESYVELVLYFNQVAVYARHWDNFEKEDLTELVNELDEFVLNSRYFTFHITDHVYIPSNMGTSISISNQMMEISKQKRGGPNNDNSLRYRSLLSYNTWIEVDIPLTDAKMTTYKYHNDEKNLKLNVTFDNMFPPSFAWINEKNTYSQTWDNRMGIIVDENKLKEYCPTCESLNEVEFSQLSNWSNKYNLFGLQFDVESSSHDGYTPNSKVFHEIWTNNLHRYNADAFPYAGPLLLAANIFNYKYWLRSDLSNGSIRSRSSNGIDEITETTWNTAREGHTSNDFKLRTLTEIKSDVTVRTLQDEVLSFVNLTAVYDWEPDFIAENTTKQTGNKLISFNFLNKPSNTNDSFKIWGRGETNFPSLRDDRLSIEPYEDTIGETVFMLTRNIDDFDDCVPEYTYTVKEIYSTSDKSNDKLSKDYEQCIADSKDLKFIAPSKECQRVSNKFTEYDNYQIQLTTTKHVEDRNETIFEEKTVFEYSRISEDTVQINFTDLLFKHGGYGDEETFSYEFYYPKMTVNPLWLSYSTDEANDPEYAHITCTITPSTIEKLSGKYIPNQRKEWFAIGECDNVSRSLNGHTIDDKHVGFTFKTDNFVVIVATVKNGQLDVTLNGKQITEFYLEEDSYLMIHFLGKNTIYVISRHIEIYYNTEYVTIRTESLYPELACGLCN